MPLSAALCSATSFLEIDWDMVAVMFEEKKFRYRLELETVGEKH
jgi:hypothetical protein